MKAIPFNISKSADRSLYFQVDEGRQFYDRLHYHKEYQITVILKGQGILYLGSSFIQYEPGDVFIIGSSAPHLIKNTASEDSKVLAHSIFLSNHFFKNEMLSIPELEPLSKLLNSAQRGIFIKQLYATTIKERISEGRYLESWKAIANLIEILGLILDNPNKIYLSHEPILQKNNSASWSKLNTVFEYTLRHLTENIKIAEVASLVNLSESQFSRYFKTSTRKTYIQFLNELRIESACALLKSESLSIDHIAIKSGFNNLSHFNETFKKIKKLTPSKYRKKLKGIK
jgi:AraC-like DNA-binding protein